ncbi:MAG: hypothetical protein K0R63_951 [Rickettsiales bacterium]|nr:hypothetical protein [Rickettsiales bacterium]
MTTTNHLNISHIRQNQAQKEVTLNEGLNRIDAILNTGAIDKGTNTPPVSPSAGDVYILGSSPTGDWSGEGGHIAYYLNSTWEFITPNEGMTLWVNDEDVLYSFDGSAWTSSSAATLDELTDVSITSASTNDLLQYNGTAFVNTQTANNLGGIGIGTSADSTNKLAVASDAILFTAGASGDTQIKVNKTTSGDTASYVFQSAWSGRAEFGIIGDNDFQLKVSADGSSFAQSFVVDHTSGDIDFKQDVYINGTLGGVELDHLEDVAVSSPSNGEILKYNGSAWVNDTVSGASSALASLDDASITSATDNDFLVYNGTDWTNEAPSTARTSMGLGSIVTQSASSVSITGGTLSGIAATLGGALSCADNLVARPEIKDYAETRAANATATGSVTVDIENGNVHELTLTGNITTLTFSNPPATGKAGNLTLILKQDGTGGRTVSWPAAVKWVGASAPVLSTAANAIDIVTLCTTDAGTIYYGTALINFG